MAGQVTVTTETEQEQGNGEEWEDHEVISKRENSSQGLEHWKRRWCPVSMTGWSLIPVSLSNEPIKGDRAETGRGCRLKLEVPIDTQLEPSGRKLEADGLKPQRGRESGVSH